MIIINGFNYYTGIDVLRMRNIRDDSFEDDQNANARRLQQGVVRNR